MEDKKPANVELNKQQLAELAIDMLHRTIVHHVFWFKEVEHQMGFEEALKIMETAYDKSKAIQLKRLSKLLGFELIDGIPAPLVNMPEEKMKELIEGLGLNLAVKLNIFEQLRYIQNLEIQAQSLINKIK